MLPTVQKFTNFNGLILYQSVILKFLLISFNSHFIRLIKKNLEFVHFFDNLNLPTLIKSLAKFESDLSIAR